MNGNELIESLIAEFGRGIQLIGRISGSVYTKKQGDADSVGAHFRHNLEFGLNLVKGIETGRVDYGNRKRDPRVENERDYAVGQFESLITEIRSLQDCDIDQMIEVRSEVDVDIWLPSSIGRELEFLHSHTVHHYALIAAKLAASGFTLRDGFGVAPSTLRYWNSLIKDKRAA